MCIRDRSDKDKNVITVDGTVEEVLKGPMFRVRLDTGQLVLAYAAGKLRMRFIKILPGDRVRVELSPYDLTKGRLVYRL